MKKEEYGKLPYSGLDRDSSVLYSMCVGMDEEFMEMGLAPGGLMRQKIYEGEGVLEGNEPVKPKVVKKLGKRKVREGRF
ncbi:MAG: hypothetical protein P1S59_12515 [bacterium]|nr:hypothetical protein [bacterium]